MNIEVDDYFELGDEKYITIDKHNYMGCDYIFVNELDENEEPKQNFKVYKCQNNGLIEEKNEEILNRLLKHFEIGFNKKLEEYYDSI